VAAAEMGAFGFIKPVKKIKKVHTHLIKVPVHGESIVADPHNGDAILMRILLITFQKLEPETEPEP
jgi:hypothetical protein